MTRWLRGYIHGPQQAYSAPLWEPDYVNPDDQIEVSFRDLIELRFVKAFRALGLSLPTIRECFDRAVEEVQDVRPFSTQRFRTDGKTIFLEITEPLSDVKMVDLRHRQSVFRSIIEPSLRDLEFDASVVSRWYPRGAQRRTVVIDPKRAFGRPIVASGVPTQVIAEALSTEGSADRVSKLFGIPTSEVRDAVSFEQKLAA